MAQLWLCYGILEEEGTIPIVFVCLFVLMTLCKVFMLGVKGRTKLTGLYGG